MTETALPPLPAPRSPLSLGALLEGALDAVRLNPIVVLAPLVLFGLVTGSGDRSTTFDAQAIRADPWVLLPFFALLGVVAILVLVVLFVAGSLAWLMTAHAALAAVDGRRVTLKESFDAGRRNLAQHAVTFLLAFLVVLAGFILLVVPGFIALAGLLPLPVILASEGLAGGAALRRAWDLTRGHRGTLFVAFLLVVLASAVASAALSWLPILGPRLAGAASGVAGGFLAATMAVYYRRAVGAQPHPPLPAASTVL